jgi:PilZ domain
MCAFKASGNHRPRELRRRVMLPARLRAGAHWADACILNISSRGLLIHSSRPAQQGSIVKLRRGDHEIVARVVWRDGSRVGLRSEERMPVEEILSLDQAQALRLTAGDGPVAERRRWPRAPERDARLRGRALEFAAVGMIAASLAFCAFAMAKQALTRPLATVAAALGG